MSINFLYPDHPKWRSLYLDCSGAQTKSLLFDERCLFASRWIVKRFCRKFLVCEFGMRGLLFHLSKWLLCRVNLSKLRSLYQSERKKYIKKYLTYTLNFIYHSTSISWFHKHARHWFFTLLEIIKGGLSTLFLFIILRNLCHYIVFPSQSACDGIYVKVFTLTPVENVKVRIF
jgi:hypothetical protein